MKKAKKTFVKEVSKVETVNGEILKDSRLEETQFESEPPYVKLYLQDIARLRDLTNSQQKILNELIYDMGYNNIVPNYKPVKEMIAKKLGMAYNTLDQGIKMLHKKGILIRKARGLYLVDPNLFGRGSWKDIKRIRLTIDYNEDGTKVLKSNIETKEIGYDGSNNPNISDIEIID